MESIEALKGDILRVARSVEGGRGAFTVPGVEWLLFGGARVKATFGRCRRKSR